ncbi:zinc-binding dehydrogenase [Rhodococcus sp. NPDC003322]
MRAVRCARGELAIVELPDPNPDRGQLVLNVLRAGICGSDLHARRHADELAGVMDELDYHHTIRSDSPTVLGHEFCGEVVERGAGAGKSFTEGTRVVSFPLVRARGGTHPTGLSPLAPGAFADKVLVEASLSFAVPDGLDSEIAALTEPMAVAHHAVRRSEIGRRDVGVVLGCGPVGLAVVCHLKARGVRTVVASDFSPGRRALATECGADVVVDPAVDSPWHAAGARGWRFSAPELLDYAVDTMDRLRKLPGWAYVNRAAQAIGLADQPHPIVFECVGVPGMLEGILAAAPLATRVVVVGVCMSEDRLRPAMAVNKELDLRFVLGYTPLEFHDTLHLLADGKVDASPLVTGTVGLAGVPSAFDVLERADVHAKVLVDPGSEVATLSTWSRPT